MDLIEWHKRRVDWWQRKLRISDYGMLWLSFLKGVILTVIVMKVFF
ncbi:MAG: hypothetical protein CMN58_02255 [Solibacterales bacterium]|nr:hypothetical protein [Bryobacterales bacterium]